MKGRRNRRIKYIMLLLAALCAAALYAGSREPDAVPLARVETLPPAAYDALRAARQERAGQEALGVTLQCRGTALPYDSRTGSFLLPAGIREREIDCRTAEPSLRLGRCETPEGEVLLAYTDEAYTRCPLWETPLPVLRLKSSREIGEEAYTDVELTVFDGGGQIDTLTVGMHTRGASSQWIPKKSYRVKVRRDDELFGKDYPFLGMRPGREWILYSFYGDESKMREKLSRDLWDEIARSGSDPEACGLEMEYCELYLNDEYMGLYGMGTAVDRRSFFDGKSSGRQDLLFKTVNFDVPTPEDIAAAAGQDACKCLELKYATWKSDDLWETVGRYLYLAYDASDPEYLAQMPDYMEEENHIDYWLFFLAAGLDDNELKNLYLSIGDAQNNTRIRITPWDMDMSWGVGYTGETIFMWGRNENQYRKIMDFPIVSRMFSAGDEAFTEKTKARWRELRRDIITEEKMLRRIDDYEALLWNSGVMEREQARWPDAPYGGDLDYIRTYVRERFVYLDAYMEQLGKGEWDDGWE